MTVKKNIYIYFFDNNKLGCNVLIKNKQIKLQNCDSKIFFKLFLIPSSKWSEIKKYFLKYYVIHKHYLMYEVMVVYG